MTAAVTAVPYPPPAQRPRRVERADADAVRRRPTETGDRDHLAVHHPEADPSVVARQPRIDRTLQLLVVVLADLLPEGEEALEDEAPVSPPCQA